MNVLIVARTKMGGTRRCFGGLTEDDRSVRLLTAAGGYFDTGAPFQVGEVWDMQFTPAANTVPPHVEDVLVTAWQKVSDEPNLRVHLLARVTTWQGGIDQIFGGVLGYTGSNNGYVSEDRGIPPQSTGFWSPDKDLNLRGDKHYDCQQFWIQRGLSYVGEPAAIPVISAGTLVRVSLARWWKPDDADDDFEERCYAQLSGWYL